MSSTEKPKQVRDAEVYAFNIVLEDERDGSNDQAGSSRLDQRADREFFERIRRVLR